MDANPRLKASVAVRPFEVPYYLLIRRRKGVPPSNTRGGHNKKLSPVQDTALKDYIFMLHSCSTPGNLNTVRIAANRLLFYSNGDLKNTVSLRWCRTWTKRQSEFLKTMKSKPLSTASRHLSEHSTHTCPWLFYIILYPLNGHGLPSLRGQ